jgi:hypothetical protein
MKKPIILEQLSQAKEMNRRMRTQRPTPLVRGTALGKSLKPMMMQGENFKKSK